MPAQITQLIDKTDFSEQVRDQIGAILLVEQAAQQQLALLSGKNPKDFKLRVFVERSNPWSEFLDRPDPQSNMPDDDASPIVNVRFDASKVDRKSSNVVEKQQYDGTYFIDCYGYGVSKPSLQGGHDPGDARAAMEAHRASRLVRNILMAGHYVTLGMTGVVGYRMVDALEAFQVQLDDRGAQNVQGLRVTLGVSFKELSPQVQGQPLETISIEVTRMENGELYFAHQIEFVDS